MKLYSFRKFFSASADIKPIEGQLEKHLNGLKNFIKERMKFVTNPEIIENISFFQKCYTNFHTSPIEVKILILKFE